jgi:hypothetical protein
MATRWYDFPARLKTVNDNAKVFRETDWGAAAGRGAEHAMATEVRERIRGSSWHLATNVRVPDTVTGEGRELDFVLVGPDGAFVIDLKHWSGSVRLESDGTLIQTSKFGEEKAPHREFFPRLHESAEVLVQHNYLHGHGFAKIGALLVFDDLDITLSDELARRADVLSRRELFEYLPAPEEASSWVSRLLMAIIRFLTGRKAPDPQRRYTPPSAQMLGLKETLRELNTWDTIALHGGRVLRGDLLINPAGPEAGTVDPLDRRAFSECVINVDRDRLRALFLDPIGYAEVCAMPVHGDGAEYQQYRVSLSRTLRIHTPAGKKETFQIRNIREIEFGYQQKAVKDHSLAELSPGMVVAGKVIRLRDKGIDIDVGTVKGSRKRMTGFAPARNQQSNSALPEVGRRVLVKIRRIFESGQMTVDLIPQPYLA